MSATELENVNPNVYKKTAERSITEKEMDEEAVDPIDEREVFGE
jgi:hypothetical protein